ncbi:hypothetical protein [Pseudomonas graminis]|uniref:hypothetical protein n=1 Tax=Pseudomonas graminis TaxID=158627 RepID=UPI0015584734|nr:hypothetical protein [Pseudomonas graminis]
MPIDTNSLTALLAWLWENGAAGIWGGVCLLVITRGSKKLRDLIAKLPTAIRTRSRKQNSPVAYLRKLKLNDLRQIRRFRFNDMWIAREISRGNTALVLFGVSAGFWLMALGLKEVMVISGERLASDSTTVFISAFPAYIFEMIWLYRSTRANRIVDYRQKVKIWRFQR